MHVEVNFSGFPFLASFRQQGGDQAQEGGFIWKETGDATAPAQLLVDAFDGVGVTHPALMGGWFG